MGSREARERKQVYLAWAVASALALAVIVGIAVTRLWPSIGALSVRNGAVVGLAEGDLVFNTGDRSHPRYFRVARAEPAEDYHLAASVSFGGDENQRMLTFEKNSDVGTIAYTVMAAGGEYDVLPAETLPSIQGYLLNMQSTDIQSEELSGKRITWYAYTYDGSRPDTGEPDGTYASSLAAYVQGKKNLSVYVNLLSQASSPEEVADAEVLYAELAQILDKITLG